MDVEVRQGSNLEGTTDALLLIRASLLIPIYSGGRNWDGSDGPQIEKYIVTMSL